MHPVKISCVSYLNSLPFVYGLRHHAVSRDIILSLDTPAECAGKLRSGVVDIGLIPVAAIPGIPGATQLSDWCIGANGPVKSVTLLSQVPLDEISTIILDFQSVTSNLLVKILAGKFWNIVPEFTSGNEGFEKSISGDKAGVVIGDRSLQIQHQFKYVYDLAWEWKKFTGLPFVFARWVSNKPVSTEFTSRFNEALSSGIQNMEQVIAELKSAPGYRQGTDAYLLQNLSYEFDENKKKGMNLFLEYASSFSSQKISELW